MPLLAPIVAWIIQAGTWLVGSQVGRIILLGLAWFGVNYVTLTVVLDPAVEALQAVMDGASASGSGSMAGLMWEWMLVFKFPGALNMVVSAYVTKLGVNGATGVFKKVTT